MARNSPRIDIYAAYGTSVAQRVALTIAVGACTGLAWWFLFGGGIQSAGAWIGMSWTPGNYPRRLVLAIMFSIYFCRLVFTQFVFLKRRLAWIEAGMIAPWILCIYVTLAIAGGTNPSRFGAVAGAGAVLFVFGSWMNTYAEFTRRAWKKHQENQGHLYTLGLFRYSRHPNYLGDLISFSGICMTSGRSVTMVIPSIMLAGFVFANIPMLDAHLQDHYGATFDEYAARTSKLIPFVY